jgi:FkbM family methyltransferase
MPAAVWKRLPVNGVFQVLLPDGRAFLYSAVPNDAIARALFWRGLPAWESETTHIFYKLAARSELVLDIGANTGVYTLLACAANPRARVISFEPVPHVYLKLVENVRLNRWESQCCIRQEAVSSTNGSAQFHVPFGELPTSASLAVEGFRGREGTLIQVPLVTVDSLLQKDDRVNLVKIDVEGFEDHVLKGMQEVLATSAPTLIIECNSDGPFRAVEAILAQFGYRFYHLRHEGPTPMDRIVPDPTETYRNFLCIAREDVLL